MKLLVQSIGNQMLLDLFGQQQVAAHRPSVVKRTTFIDLQRGRKLEVLEELADDASDASLALATNEAELAAAIEALPRAAKPEPKVAPAPKPAAKK